MIPDLFVSLHLRQKCGSLLRTLVEIHDIETLEFFCGISEQLLHDLVDLDGTTSERRQTDPDRGIDKKPSITLFALFQGLQGLFVIGDIEVCACTAARPWYVIRLAYN